MRIKLLILLASALGFELLGSSVAIKHSEADLRRHFLDCQECAKTGDADALARLADCYYFGRGVAEDLIEAVKLYRKAAMLNHAGAQQAMGNFYASGSGVKKDFQEATRWFRLAAAQEHPIAQACLGDRYARGEGVKRDQTEAVRWYRKAAENDVSWAQNCLGDSYAKGLGVPKNAVMAVAWYDLASDKSAENVKRRNAVVKQLTPQQIAEAQECTKDLRVQIAVRMINSGKLIRHWQF